MSLTDKQRFEDALLREARAMYVLLERWVDGPITPDLEDDTETVLNRIAGMEVER